ncbi:polysaccharide biosynthesis tyrosine autokinase [Vibrio sp. Of7-15]|uniref:GumC family protein n=1 Tax=Vibrio sp. Of7-15 TaxID=2724879 RepID=UPI001EF18410|nr:polysaccharide biosynthesis tyrosine autokinase [Vibrio sp. Of7-15]MCG7498513.1 polysaccharide biosynthesis tyrosine autokinase [Vibrio sp. Of7-15]
MQFSTPDELRNNEITIDFSKYLNNIKKNWLKISLFTLLCTIIATLTVLSITPSYRATATLLIESEQKKAVSIEEIVGIDSSKKEYYSTQYEILKSNNVAKKVINELDLYSVPEFNGQKENSSPSLKEKIIEFLKQFPLMKAFFPEKPEVSNETRQAALELQVLSIFKSKLTISPIRSTQLVKITFESQDPILAAKVANTVGKAFIENNLDSRLSATQQASGWITSRLQELKEQLISSEEQLTEFLEREQLIDNSGIDNLTSTELRNLTNRLSKATDRRVAAESLYNTLQKNQNTDLSTLASISEISNHPQIRDIRKSEIDIEKQVNELAKRYGPKHDKMIRAQAQLKSVQQRANNVVKELARGIEKELQSARHQESIIREELSNKKEEFQILTVKKTRYDSLKREVDTNSQLYNLFLTRQKETSATSDFQAANARFTDHAMVPLIPASPKKTKLIIASMFASLMAAITFSILISSLKNTIESTKDFEDKFGLIPLGGIPIVKNKKFKKKDLDNSIFFNQDEYFFSESIRSIRTSLLLNAVNNNRKRISISSSVPGEGKTTTAINLAMSLSKMEKVVLIDCDLRKPAIAERFGLKKNKKGLTNYLLMGSELEECLYRDEQSGLVIIPAGMLSPNPQELLSSSKFESLLNKLEEKVDRIILDTPPTLSVSDSLVVSRLANATVIVVKANSTKQNLIQNTMAKMLKHDILIDGVIVNQINKKSNSVEHGYSAYGEYYQAAES